MTRWFVAVLIVGVGIATVTTPLGATAAAAVQSAGNPGSPSGLLTAIVQRSSQQPGANATAIMTANVDDIEHWVEKAAGMGARLVVLPELSLGVDCSSREAAAGFAFQLDPGTTACQNVSYNNQPLLQRLSCLTQRLGVLLVLGIVRKVPCGAVAAAACPEGGSWLYNAAALLAADGSFGAVYHKAHLFALSACMDSGEVAAVTYVERQSGVVLGLLVCFDIEFDASLAALLAAGADAIVVPMEWDNVLPVSDAVAMQRGVSGVYNTTVIAANTALDGGSGSGVYSQGVVVASYFHADVTVDPGIVLAVVHRSDDRVPLPPRPQTNAAIDFSTAVPAGKTVSPCGPPLLSVPTSSCSVISDPHPNTTYVLAATSVNLQCSATIVTLGT